MTQTHQIYEKQLSWPFCTYSSVCIWLQWISPSIPHQIV